MKQIVVIMLSFSLFVRLIDSISVGIGHGPWHGLTYHADMEGKTMRRWLRECELMVSKGLLALRRTSYFGRAGICDTPSIDGQVLGQTRMQVVRNNVFRRLPKASSVECLR